MLFQRVRRCKKVTFDNFCAISLATAMEHHRANQFLKTATNLNFVQPKLFQPTRQDDHCFSDCTVFVIQILDDADVVFRISDAEFADGLRFYPRPPCSQASRTASTGELSRSDLVPWPFATVCALREIVRSRR